MAQGAVKKSGKRSQAVSAKKEAILAAALEAFSQFGIHGTRLEQVAERAGVSKTNLLYYYPSKEALYVAVLQQILRHLAGAAEGPFVRISARWWRSVNIFA
ncbi:transcriptional regulator RutR [Klebsiella pneumoniae]|nr:transcriptional regulator RutR [Klebsiella pneumoniae]